VRPVLHDEADRQRHWAGAEHLLRHRAGTCGKDSLLQRAGGRRGLSRGASRSAGGAAYAGSASERWFSGKQGFVTFISISWSFPSQSTAHKSLRSYLLTLYRAKRSLPIGFRQE